MNRDEIAEAIYDCFFSVNECDQNGEPVNIVDAICKAARLLMASATVMQLTPMRALEAHDKATRESAECIAEALGKVADAINQLPL